MRTDAHTCGMNSRQIVVSMGMFPPTPMPTNAVRTKTPLYVDGAPRQRPKIDEMRTVRLNAYCRPIEQVNHNPLICGAGCEPEYQPTMSTRTPHTKACHVLSLELVLSKRSSMNYPSCQSSTERGGKVAKLIVCLLF